MGQLWANRRPLVKNAPVQKRRRETQTIAKWLVVLKRYKNTSNRPCRQRENTRNSFELNLPPEAQHSFSTGMTVPNMAQCRLETTSTRKDRKAQDAME